MGPGLAQCHHYKAQRKGLNEKSRHSICICGLSGGNIKCMGIITNNISESKTQRAQKQRVSYFVFCLFCIFIKCEVMMHRVAVRIK